LSKITVPGPSPRPSPSTQTYTGPLTTNHEPFHDQQLQTLPFTGAEHVLMFVELGLILLITGIAIYLLVRLRRWSRS
jgi:hypothetical protein